MVIAALLTSGIGLLTFGGHELLPKLVKTNWFLPAAYFGLSIAHSVVRVGRKTNVVDLPTGNKRTDYVAISNTVIGVLMLVGSLGALAPVIGNHGLIALLSLMGLAGAFLGTGPPEIQARRGRRRLLTRNRRRGQVVTNCHNSFIFSRLRQIFNYSCVYLYVDSALLRREFVECRALKALFLSMDSLCSESGGTGKLCGKI